MFAAAMVLLSAGFRSARTLGVWVLLLLPQSAHAQRAIDSLQRALRTIPADTEQVKTALRLSAALAATDTAQARQAAAQALRQSQRLGYAYGQAHSWLQLSALHLIGHRYNLARQAAERARQAAEPLLRRKPGSGRLRRLLASIANNLGSAADQQGQLAAATRYYLQAAGYLENTSETAVLLTVYTNLGRTFQLLRQPEQATRYWRRAVVTGGPSPRPELLPAYLQLAAWHLQQQQPDSAYTLLQLARPLHPEASLYAGEYYGTLGQYYLFRQQPERAYPALQRAATYAARKGDPAYQARLLFNLGQLEAQLGNTGRAVELLRNSLQLLHPLHDTDQEAAVLTALGRLAESTGQYQTALRYYRRSQHLRDSLAAATVRQQVNQLETLYRTRQQAQQLQQLRQQQAAQQLALRQQRRLNTLYLLLAGVLGVAVLLALGLLRHRRRLARQQQELQQQRIRQLEQEQELRAAQSVLQGQEEERRRVARDLHDGLGGMLSTVKLYLGTLRTRHPLPEPATELLGQSVEHLDSSISELRRVARNLMPEALLALGLAQAVQDFCDALRRTGQLQVELHLHGLTERLPPALETGVYRIAQELLNNVVKHAQARHVLVQLMRHDALLHVVIEDDGRGFDPTLASTGVGLRSLQARAEQLGGQLTFESETDQGTTATLTLPVPTTGAAPLSA
ncbi:tetratricopeptide repeat-containing sensor histidine kinase [Hymenobacter sp. 102]|uniref:tetratricopeptide repeat-containing sensor histidine kinase n=1 Tax=Hymenobacter sp. 102 TaxID=3403152 RepID=UPI003CEC9635